MKYSVFTNIVAFKKVNKTKVHLDFNDTAICCWIRWMAEGTKTTKVDFDGRTYYHLGYEKLLLDLPLLPPMQNRAIRKRIDKLVLAGMLIRHPHNKSLGKSFFALTDDFIEATSSEQCVVDGWNISSKQMEQKFQDTQEDTNNMEHKFQADGTKVPTKMEHKFQDRWNISSIEEKENKEEKEKEREEEADGLARFSIQNLKSLSEKAIASQSLNEGQKQNTYAPLLHLCSKYASDESFCYWWDECIKDKKESHYVNLTPQKCLLWLQDAPEKIEDAIEELKNSVAKGWKTPFGKKEFQQKTVSQKNSLEKTKHYENENTNYSKKWKK